MRERREEGGGRREEEGRREKKRMERSERSERSENEGDERERGRGGERYGEERERGETTNPTNCILAIGHRDREFKFRSKPVLRTKNNKIVLNCTQQRHGRRTTCKS
jgi:hypothetical protein